MRPCRRLKPIIISTVGMIVSAIIYQYCEGVVWLGLLLAIFYCFWNYGTVYQLSFVSQLDPSGRSRS
jgi:hypothetical protein